MTAGRERAVTFGPRASLAGVVTEPAAGTEADGKPAFVMLNSGILHRVGTCRLHVRLARALSAEGFASLRFDYSGIGDSEPRHDSLPFAESAVAETRLAMDFLGKRNHVDCFVLMGLCSGADMAHETALVDDRVAGLMLIDAWAYRTFRHYVHHYAPRLLRRRVWSNAIRLRVRMLLDHYRAREAAHTHPDTYEAGVPRYLRVFPPRTRVERDLRDFVARRIAMYFMWTGGLPEYNHQGQYAASFAGIDFAGLLREEHLPDADHILTGLPQQDYVLRNVVQWARELQAGAAAACEQKVAYSF